MDEKTARTKWCPHMRVHGSNRDYSVTPPNTDRFRCVASDCMMWEPYLEGGSAGDCDLKRKNDD